MRRKSSVELADLEPEIIDLLVTELIQVPPPDSFRGHISEQDIADFEKRDRKTVLAMSRAEQWIDWLVDVQIMHNENARRLDVEQARQKVKQPVKQLWKLSKWAVSLIGAGLCGALGKSLLDKILP